MARSPCPKCGTDLLHHPNPASHECEPGDGRGDTEGELGGREPSVQGGESEAPESVRGASESGGERPEGEWGKGEENGERGASEPEVTVSRDTSGDVVRIGVPSWVYEATKTEQILFLLDNTELSQKEVADAVETSYGYVRNVKSDREV